MKKKKDNTDYQKIIDALGKKPKWQKGFSILCDGFNISSVKEFESALFRASLCLETTQDRERDSLEKLEKCAAETRSLLDNETNYHRLVQHMAGFELLNRNKIIDEVCKLLEDWETMLRNIENAARKAHKPPPPRGNIAKTAIRDAILTLAIFWREILGREFTQQFEDDSQTPKSEAAKFICCCFSFITKDLQKFIPSLRRNMISIINSKDYEKQV